MSDAFIHTDSDTPSERPGSTVRPWSPLLWFWGPALALLLLALFPPHVLDRAISLPFFDGTGWPWRTDTVFAWVFYRLTKIVPAFVALVSLGILGASVWRRFRTGVYPFEREVLLRHLYMLLAMGLSVGLVWWLKATTGVACPWSLEEFGGTAQMTNPVFGFATLPGRCWPGGHAGTGFCLFALYFAFRDRFATMARQGLLLALVLGYVCGMSRVMQGAHFFSHNVATMLVDWLVCATLYVVIFDRKGALKRIVKALAQPLPVASGVVFTALWWTAVFDLPLFRAILVKDPSGRLFFTLAVAAAFFAVAMGLLVLLSLLPKFLFRATLAVLALAGGTVFAGSELYGTVFTPDMVRNFLATDAREATAYLSIGTIGTFLVAALPALWAALRIESPGVRDLEDLRRFRASSGSVFARLRSGAVAFVRRRAGVWVRNGVYAVLCTAVGVGLLLVNFQSFAGLMREDKTLRYGIAPVGIVYSFVRTIATDESPDGARVRRAVDPAPKATVASGPALFVVVVGETTRSADWGLAGYERDTTPRLRAVPDLISYPKVRACGTSTDVSVPCMMSRIGRSDYDRDRILSEEALPSLLQRSGLNVLWIDNQSGCKGVCAGVPSRAAKPDTENYPDGFCSDAVLVKEVKHLLTSLDANRPTVVFLHMYGQHGPAYYKGSRKETKAFAPECEAADLSSCSSESVRNAYDNAVRETDAVLADIIDTLRRADATGVPTGMLWVSDHGESLGEKGLFLHGAPYFMALDEQKEVPMVMWISDAFASTFSVDRTALVRASRGTASHENLYSTVLGLLKVESTTYRAEYDLGRTN